MYPILTRGATKKRASFKLAESTSLKKNEEDPDTGGVVRCAWLKNDPLYIAYHDEEWGKPEYDSIRLFELLCLEGQQAGLSWFTILKKRENYRKSFYNFDPNIVSQLKNNDIERILLEGGIIKHRAKIEAIINNAQCFLNMQNNGEEFSDFIWSFVDNKPVINKWTNIEQVPSKTEVSDALCGGLKKRGFKYVGSIICYAFMQACGMVNDHTTNCICYNNKV